jgi:SAM-dependent methyltransferase
MSWEWDETLYAGSAAYYARGRFAYPPQLADALRDALSLDGTGRLLDVGCGPGPLTRLLAPLFAEAVGIDADAAMVAEAAARAPANARFVHMRAEALPGGLGTFRAATFAQSFHWMDQHVVAAKVFELLEPGGTCVLVSATTHQGEGNVPRDEIVALVKSYLGPVRRAGRGLLPEDPPWHVPEAFDAAGFAELIELEVPAGQVHERSEDDIVASIHSQSSAAPHLFGERREEFERELRALLRAASPEGRFHERARDVGLRIWRKRA